MRESTRIDNIKNKLIEFEGILYKVDDSGKILQQDTDGNWINKGIKNLSELKAFIILNIRKEKLNKI